MTDARDLIPDDTELGMPADRARDPNWELSPKQVHAMRAAHPERVVILDVRRPDEIQLASIDGAVHIPMDQLAARLDEAEDLAENNAGDDRLIVTMCHMGVRSFQVAVALREAGTEGVYSMAGGIDLWSQEVDRQVPRY